jgi:hypothetical protein
MRIFLLLAFQIPQSWHHFLGFVSGLLAITSLFLALFHWQQKRFRKQADQLENLVSARTLELAMANADLERLSVTDPLTGLKNRCESACNIDPLLEVIGVQN